MAAAETRTVIAIGPGDPGHGPYYRLTHKVNGKTVTETFSSPAALAKAQREVAEYHRFRELGDQLLQVNEEICPAAAGGGACAFVVGKKTAEAIGPGSWARNRPAPACDLH